MKKPNASTKQKQNTEKINKKSFKKHFEKKGFLIPDEKNLSKNKYAKLYASIFSCHQRHILPKINTVNLDAIAEDIVLLEVGRKAIEKVLVDWRKNRFSQPGRGNGLVIREKNGADSHIIRMGPEEALRIGLKAIAKHMEQKISNRRKHGG